MAFSLCFERAIGPFFLRNKDHLITPTKFFAFLNKEFPMLLGSKTTSKPFYLYLKSFGLQGSEQLAFATFINSTPYTLEEFKLKFLQEWTSLLYRRSQRNNAQVFYYQLLCKWNGLSLKALNFLHQTSHKMPSATFKRKINRFSQQQEQDNLQIIQTNPSVVWFDNFTKIFSRDYIFQEDNKSYSFYDLTVCCGFLFPPDHHSTVMSIVRQREALLRHKHSGLEVFNLKTDLIFTLPVGDQQHCSYKRYTGTF